MNALAPLHPAPPPAPPPPRAPAPLARAVAVLRSGRVARAILLYLAVFCGIATWLPWAGSDPAPAPRWAVATGLDQPFSSWPFLAGVAALFASTLACTWGRWTRLVALWRGARPAGAVALAGSPQEVARFLAAQGFGGAGAVRRRFAPALFAGWVLHVGLLLLVGGVLVERCFHERGNFELTDREQADLSAPGVVFDHERGPLAPSTPPAVLVALDHFDPFLVQAGYAPDRFSRIELARPGEPLRPFRIDRAAGVDFAGVTIYQAIPTGLSLLLDIEGVGLRTLHLQPRDATRSTAQARLPDGGGLDLEVRTERPHGARTGTGRVELLVGAERRPVAEGESFAFGPVRARLAGFARWGGFSYVRSPGKPAAWAGIAVVLLGCALLVFPSGVARVEPSPGDPTAWVFVVRGAELLVEEWNASRAAARQEEGTG